MEIEDMSLQSLSQKRNDLQSDVRKAGITGQDQAFLNSFSEELAENKSNTTDAYVPSESEINQSLKKA